MDGEIGEDSKAHESDTPPEETLNPNSIAARPDLPPSEPVVSAHRLVHNAAYHSRNNESFSRSRTSTDASMDLLNAAEPSEGNLQPAAHPSQHGPADDFDIAFENTIADRKDIDSPETAGDHSAVDDFNAAFELEDTFKSLPESAPSSAAPNLPMMTSDMGTSLQETVEELQEPIISSGPIMSSEHTTSSEHISGIPVPAEDTDFGGALREVSNDLQTPLDESALAVDGFAVSEGGDNEWLKDTSKEDPLEDDAWTQALGSTEKKKGEPSWDSTFAEGFDDDGFLDEDGFLEDEAPPSTSQSTQPPLPRSNSYIPAGASSQPAYTPLLSQPQTPAQQPVVSPFAPRSPMQTRSTSSEQKHITKFFEDLPVTQRARKPKQQLVATPGAQPSNVGAPSNPPVAQQRPPSRQTPPSSVGNLQRPEKLDLFPPQPTLSPDGPAYASHAAMDNRNLNTLPPQSSRYSPAPGSAASTSSRYSAAPASSVPPTNARYSPAPTAPQPPVPQKDPPYTSAPPTQTSQLPFPPQTRPVPPHQASSRYSPLPAQPSTLDSASQSPPSTNYSPIDPSQAPLVGPPPSLSSHKFAPRTSSPLAQSDARPSFDRSNTAPMPPPPPPASTSSPESTRSQPISSNGPPPGPARPTPPRFEAPKRPRTLSPDRQGPKYAPRTASEDRRSSLRDHPVVSRAAIQQRIAPATTISMTQPAVPFRTRGPSLSDNVEFVQPEDSDEISDPLQRWKGTPKLHWSSGTTMLTHFPKRDLRFGGGRSAPACKCSAGDLNISRIRERMPIDNSLTSFPGPLKSKSKKKDLLLWLSSRLDALQAECPSAEVSMDARVSERLLLWKLMRIFVEHDGVLSGNPTVDNALREALVPPQDETISGRHSRSGSIAPALGQPTESNNIYATIEIRRHLLAGDREKAVWHAVDNKLWGHAMLIASTAEGNLWKQVSHEFVRSEVRSSSSDRKSLAAFYSVMAQNFDESIDELVPASARAGFQMMPTADAGGQGQNAMDGLNKWQETLSLIVSNRSPQDEFGVVALGKLLRDYGRIEAAHICFLFAPSIVRLGGLDDSEAHFSLLGADAVKTGGQDTDAILLTEVYEFGLSLRPNAGTQYIPHLQAYKLHHANILADSGLRSEASQYCDAISTAIKSMTRPSPYYHPALIMRLEDLNQRLSQAPKDSSSWISKPAVGKVSGSMWAKFNSFVAGDEDAASNGSGPQSENEAGPFARLPSGTPTISRNTSHADLTAFTPMGAAPLGASLPGAGGNSRYAPNYAGPVKPVENTPQSYQSSTLNSAPHDIPKPSNYAPSPSRSDSFGQSPAAPVFSPYQPSNNHLGISDTASIASSYDPPILEHPGLTAFGSPSTTFTDRGTSSHGLPHDDMPVIAEESMPHENGYSPLGGSSYEPPGSGGYVPYEAQDDSPPPSAKPNGKKKSVMDLDEDDDQLVSRAASLRPSSASASATRAPSEAVRKAAQADAERDRKAKEERAASGWFGGWFGGKKDPNAPVVHKAKLGEENSFYFDPELKRWVNKKDPNADTSSAAPTPPPPKAANTPPLPRAPPSRSATPASVASVASEGAGGPPSGNSTGGGSSGGLDDLLQPGGKRGTAKRGKRRQVASVMDM